MKNTLLRITLSLAIVTVIIPVIGFSTTSTVRPTRSDTYIMGTGATGVPYYVYGYDVKINTASAVQVATPPTAPKLPIAGGGGKTLEKPTR